MHIRRLYAYAVGILTVGAILWPVSGLQNRDSFPLSTYPMFTARRKRVVLYTVLGVSRKHDGTERLEPIPPRFIANQEVMQATVTVRRAARRGREGQRRFCDKVAAEVAGASEFSHVAALEIVRDVYDPLRYFASDGQPIKRSRLHRCKVLRK